ncbi:Late competence development protein ComFB [Ferrimonas balearica DSM 9799]|uniref:Late competence development protein ComFB n=1 Tax=Ferrimonas balearica (strain DSM 9799 / CCM 4581 / KCTC 23876 / PAT) TaxID=550540 RepID=E1SW73_FERBD|nr:late competence development ComFB family protein [Ferrimonas balearica]MBY6018359.1 late competence development ComFB family protein [Halomonas denitrificans]ADN75362.1 Late competence development protein ComFB [Ferrimonas balearica DSM 9799]MBW3138278.1 late competence development ComFB family protein [Ferrimonas balearica]MBW3164174.1 late competence development ComFB family protein [Ferrimonas balearica]MBY5979020.1 late competence development ComFB family protein [Ferrimonas balearica]
MELDIRNYNETLVRQVVLEQGLHLELNEDQLTDLTCLALNKLPARYIRYPVDLAGYTSSTELESMITDARNAIDVALTHLKLHPRQD